MTPKEKKILIYGSIGLGSYLLYKVFFPTKDIFNNNNTIGTNPSLPTPTTPKFDPHKEANKGYELMKSSFSDKDAIFKHFEKFTQDQFRQIFQAFGERKYNSILGSSAWGGHNRNLKLWLESELDKNRFLTLQLKFPNQLL